MRTADQWLDEYGSSHRNQTNEVLHWICVPVILWCVLGLLWITPFPGSIRAAMVTHTLVITTWRAFFAA